MANAKVNDQSSQIHLRSYEDVPSLHIAILYLLTYDISKNVFIAIQEGGVKVSVATVQSFFHSLFQLLPLYDL